MIVLNELSLDPRVRELVRPPALHEESARVAEYLRFDERHAVNGSLR